MSKEPVSVVLADDHALVLEGLRSLLDAEVDIVVIATATDAERLLDAVGRFQPDVVISDVNMPYMEEAQCVADIRRLSPKTRVLFLTAYTDGQTMQAVLNAGAEGLLLKTDPPEQTIIAIQQVMAGQLVFPAVAQRWLTKSKESPPANPLSEREQAVLALIAEGLTNAQAAVQLHISENTIKYHLRNIYQHIGVTNRTEASRWYLENGG